MEKFSSAIIQHQHQQQQIVINGQPVNQHISAPFLLCTCCGRALAQFEPNTPTQQLIAFIEHNIKPDTIYCPKCGSKLSYAIDIIDAVIDKTE